MSNCRIFLLALLASGWLARISPAQEVYAQIKGTVTDPSGAAVQAADVTATNTRTAGSVTVPSGGDGSFAFLQLPVGSYDVTVTKNGFATFVERGITLALNQIYDLPVALEMGQMHASVEVQADPVQVDKFTTQLGNIVDAPKIVDLPLNGRNWTQLQQLSPGVVAASDRNGTYATDGSQSQQNSYLINGADSIDLERNLPSIIPSPDAIQEFNLIDSTINPEFGRNSGGILNAIIKSGTNQFHAAAFEFYRDTFLNGRNLFQQSAPIYHQNQFGGTLGGPIWKDHTFFFVSYQGSRFRQPESGVSAQTTVFSSAQRNGYFPDLATSTAVSPTPLVGESGLTYPAGTPYSVIFPTGHIPSADINPISQRLLGYVPLPNASGNLYAFNPLQTGTQDQGIVRVDHTFSWKDALWASAFFEDSPTVSTLPAFGASLPGFDQLDSRAYKQITADWTHTFSPTMLN
ncbi:MAG: carboxypeptidase regulatory-like domain-containing protein, partial [Acidobacteriaceae bacterium]|nr:carboxypeptidase regulatory-like domain-containing protein [Acidobacteriaceae bacterium]